MLEQVFIALIQRSRRICNLGKDKKFVWAEAKLIGKDTVEVWSDKIKEPTLSVMHG